MESKDRMLLFVNSKSWKDLDYWKEEEYLAVTVQVTATIEQDNGVTLKKNNICFKMADTC